MNTRAPNITSTATAIGPTIPAESATAEEDEEEDADVELDDTVVVSLEEALLEVVEVDDVLAAEVVLPPTTVSPFAFTAEGACVEHSLTETDEFPVTPLMVV